MSSHSHLKEMKCDTCPTVLPVDRQAIGCQCSNCCVSRVRKPRVESHDPIIEQLELGEVAS